MSSTDEEKILDICISMLREGDTLKPKTLQQRLLDNSLSLGLNQKKYSLAKKSYENYIFMSHLLIRLLDLRNTHPDQTSWWTDERYASLKATGILLNKCVHRLNNASDRDFLYLLQILVEALPCGKDEITSLFKEEYELSDSFKCSSHNREAHDTLHSNLSKRIGQQYLSENGCRFYATEIDLEKRSGNRTGIRVDLLGWNTSGHIVGLEVKTRPQDFNGARDDLRLDRYLSYCNQFFILTQSQDVFESASRWKRSSPERQAVGILLCDTTGSSLLKQDLPTESKREVTPKMLRCIRQAVKISLKREIDSISLRNATTPEQAAQAITAIHRKQLVEF